MAMKKWEKLDPVNRQWIVLSHYVIFADGCGVEVLFYVILHPLNLQLVQIF